MNNRVMILAGGEALKKNVGKLVLGVFRGRGEKGRLSIVGCIFRHVEDDALQ